jgi:hypothetical protein
MRKVRLFDDEPPLAELIDDPLVRAVMARDGVSPSQLIEVLAEAKRRLAVAEPV